jgi:hypothetical protein
MNNSTSSVVRVAAVLSTVALCCGTLPANELVISRWNDPSLARAAAGVPLGGSLRIDDVDLERDRPPESFELERFRVFARDARVVIHSAEGSVTVPPPADLYFRGSVVGRDGAQVYLTIGENDRIRGLMSDRGRYWIVHQAAEATLPGLREVTAAELEGAGRSFRCRADELPRPQSAATAAAAMSTATTAGPGTMARTPSYTAHIAVETDYEYYQLFGSATAAARYIGDLFGYASGYYASEVSTTFWVKHVSLWTTAADPWTQASSLCCLAEFGKYWNDNNGAIRRTLAHFLSGKSAGGGIAWQGVLCAGPWMVDISTWGCSLSPTWGNYGGDYSFSGDIVGNFNIASPAIVWDIYAMSHEVGHNFDSPHTHCFSPPVDQCYGLEAGCYQGTPSLPCPTPGAGCGTIMSYCHLISPGITNISLTLGQGHPWGVAPERVPQAMSSYVVTTAAANPACLRFALFADGFEAGDTSRWSAAVP